MRQVFGPLSPAIEMAEVSWGSLAFVPAAIGFGLGALFLFALDKFMPHTLHLNFDIEHSEGVKTKFHKTTLLILAITLHNTPWRGLRRCAFGGVAAGLPEATIGGAVTPAIGIGIQNFPEGIAVSFPLRRAGASR